MDIGNAGNAFRQIANKSSVKHNPWKRKKTKRIHHFSQFISATIQLTIKIATKQAIVVFQSP